MCSLREGIETMTDTYTKEWAAQFVELDCHIDQVNKELEAVYCSDPNGQEKAAIVRNEFIKQSLARNNSALINAQYQGWRGK